MWKFPLNVQQRVKSQTMTCESVSWAARRQRQSIHLEFLGEITREVFGNSGKNLNYFRPGLEPSC